MEFFPTAQDFVTIGNFSIKWYAVLICIGGILCYLISSKLLRQCGTVSYTHLTLPTILRV